MLQSAALHHLSCIVFVHDGNLFIQTSCVCVQLDLLVSSREEALLMADAFRIAFEQQLRKRSDRLLLQAEALTPRSHPRETQGKSEP